MVPSHYLIWTNAGLLSIISIHSADNISIELDQFHSKILLRADSRFAPSQWEAVLLCNNVSHWLGASLEWALLQLKQTLENNNPDVSGLTLSWCTCWFSLYGVDDGAGVHEGHIIAARCPQKAVHLDPDPGTLQRMYSLLSTKNILQSYSTHHC